MRTHLLRTLLIAGTVVFLIAQTAPMIKWQ